MLKKQKTKKTLKPPQQRVQNPKKKQTAALEHDVEQNYKIDTRNDYDSMIDNNSSDDSDVSNFAESNNDDSDDGFSERESDNVVTHTNKPLTPTISNKRKNDLKEHLSTSAHINKKPKTEKVKPPTLEEINELKETRNLFHSNLFRLQVKEMLNEIKIKEKYTKFINNWMDLLKTFLKTAPGTNKEDVSCMKWQKECQLKMPLNLQHLGVQIAKQKSFQFQFIKPQLEPYLIGAAASQTLLGPVLFADICVTMPPECFQKENYLNLVYDQKRALYLTYLAWQILKNKVFPDVQLEHIQFNYYSNNPLKPILEISPPTSAGSISHKLKFRIFVSADEKSFKISRFVPWNSNIRAVIFQDAAVDDDIQPTATPNYNNNVLFDMTMQHNQKLLSEIFQNQKNFQDGLVLLKIWLRQRQLNIGFSGFNSHILAMFIVYLQQQRKLHANMSSYQVARTVWNNLALSRWDEEQKGISLQRVGSDQPNQPTLEQFHVHFPIVFIDATGYYNICGNLSLEIYHRIRLESKLAVDLLNDMNMNSFQVIFMTKYPIYMQVDHVLKLNKTEAIDQILEMHVEPADKCNFVGFAFPLLMKTICRLLKKGLAQRIRNLMPIEELSEAWPAHNSPANTKKHLHLGIILNPANAFDVLDKGPESISETAEEFRKFWGSKAELRRFQDGTITESVVWGTSKDTLMQKRVVVRSIIQHLLQHHFQLEAKDIAYVADEFDCLYKLTPIFKVDRLKHREITQHYDAVEAASLVVRAFDDLARQLHNLNDLPLEIVNVASYSPVFRCCEPEPILPQARVINDDFFSRQVQRGVIQLGSSGKWPNELTALRALKAAFYLQIAQVLREKCKLSVKVTYEGLLILKHGFCFGIELAHPKEIALLKREVSDRGITQYVHCPASIALEKRQYILPKVTGALNALNQMYPSYGPTVMIAKRWLYAQLIDDGLWPDECTELLIATLYLKKNDEQITATPQVGFMRFLQLLSTANWRTDLFLLNFNNVMDENVIADLEQTFNEQRDTFPLLAIATCYDQPHYGKLWSSSEQPNSHVLSRVKHLAEQALEIIEQSLLASDETFINPETIFKASNEGYNLVIQIKPDEVPTTLARDYGSAFAAFSRPNWRLPLAGTNYLKSAVQQLREAYSDYAAFFYNPCGGKEIGIVWKPAPVFAEKPFKVGDVNGCTLSERDPTKVQCLKDTLIEDFKFILKDYYLRIDTVDRVLSASRLSLQNCKKDRYFDKSTLSTKENETSAINMKTVDRLDTSLKQSEKNKSVKRGKTTK